MSSHAESPNALAIRIVENGISWVRAQPIPWLLETLNALLTPEGSTYAGMRPAEDLWAIAKERAVIPAAPSTENKWEQRVLRARNQPLNPEGIIVMPTEVSARIGVWEQAHPNLQVVVGYGLPFPDKYQTSIWSGFGGENPTCEASGPTWDAALDETFAAFDAAKNEEDMKVVQSEIHRLNKEIDARGNPEGAKHFREVTKDITPEAREVLQEMHGKVTVKEAMHEATLSTPVEDNEAALRSWLHDRLAQEDMACQTFRDTRLGERLCKLVNDIRAHLSETTISAPKVEASEYKPISMCAHMLLRLLDSHKFATRTEALQAVKERAEMFEAFNLWEQGLAYIVLDKLYPLDDPATPGSKLTTREVSKGERLEEAPRIGNEYIVWRSDLKRWEKGTLLSMLGTQSLGVVAVYAFKAESGGDFAVHCPPGKRILLNTSFFVTNDEERYEDACVFHPQKAMEVPEPATPDCGLDKYFAVCIASRSYRFRAHAMTVIQQAKADGRIKDVDYLEGLVEMHYPLDEEIAKRSAKSVNEWAQAVYDNSKAKGFHDDDNRPERMAEYIANLHGEVSELWEAYRGDALNKPCDKAEKMKAVGTPVLTCAQEELADIIIRAMDTAVGLGIDIDAAVAGKHAFNTTRPRKHGKKA